MDSKSIRIFIAASILCLFFTPLASGAVGCTLNDPDRDVKRIFPESTGYRTDFISIEERGGEELKTAIEKKLGDKFDTIYEGIDVPYAYYTILKGRDTIGRIHGVNQKGAYGGIQLIVATDPDGRVIDFYYQKLSSPEAGKFKDESFTEQFIGITLDNIDKRSLDIEDPSDNNKTDFDATLRGVRKNLILLDEFFLSREE